MPSETVGQTAALDRPHPPSRRLQHAPPLDLLLSGHLLLTARQWDCAGSSAQSAASCPTPSSSTHPHQSEICSPAAAESASPLLLDNVPLPPSDRKQAARSPLRRPAPAP